MKRDSSLALYATQKCILDKEGEKEEGTKEERVRGKKREALKNEKK